MKILSFLIIGIGMLLSSCSYMQDPVEKPMTKSSSSQTGYVTAKIQYTGPVEADGLGYVINVDDVSYKAENLSQAFSVDGLEVIIKYKLTGRKFPCFCAVYPDIIHIEDIRRK